MLGLYYREHNDPQKAFDHFQYLAAIQTSNPVWQIELGNTALALGSVEEAVKYMQNAIDLDPASSTAWKSLARLSYVYGVDMRDTALPSIRQAILLSPEVSELRLMQGQILQALGDDYSAERSYLQALSLDGNQIQAHFNLGVMHLERGRRDQAFFHLSKAAMASADLPEKDLALRYIQLYFEQ